jgi:hypothetical protein
MSQLTQTTDEVEQLRQHYIHECENDTVTDGDWKELSKPGSFGCHELLDRTSIAMSGLERDILSHPACLQNKEWFELAHTAVEALNNLYQKVGAAHL